MKKIVYIAHPIGGDVQSNVNKVLSIVAELNRCNPNVVPFAPYIVDVLALDDSVPSDRARGFENNKALFEKCVDEVWLFGNRISDGMKIEIGWAKELEIKARDFTYGKN